jgi:hypothetical protein
LRRSALSIAGEKFFNRDSGITHGLQTLPGPTISYGPSFEPEASVISGGIITAEPPNEAPSTA